ncbi:uncharacterized protein LOC118445669 [Vespa mandarinia]|uniref:uncharacterized protein LOC118445662 n=1 Tax=Vespa mandarinia TaxID=7446 RepID=UPI00161E7CBD|nr:uncharacterized protein LOC118445662 [Vespa mandarinia]XP_035731251.1 uncharacterized protein LOC118445669 [Vespa mandarinia]
MSRCDKDSDEEICADILSDFSYDSDSESQDIEESNDDDIIPRSRVFIRRRISSSSETTSDEEADEWSSIDNPPDLEEFLGHPGITNMAKLPESTVDAVKLFIGDDFFAYLVAESNRYYYQNMNQFKISPKSMKWRDITIPEMKTFLGLIIFMGQVRKDVRDDYRSTDVCRSTLFFLKLCQGVDFAKYGRLGISITMKTSQTILIGYSKVYNAGKIIKYGILIRILSESDTGYICNFKVYAAQGLRLIETIRTVVSPYTDVWHHLYMDNHYNSVDNTEALLQKKI